MYFCLSARPDAHKMGQAEKEEDHRETAEEEKNSWSKRGGRSNRVQKMAMDGGKKCQRGEQLKWQMIRVTNAPPVTLQLLSLMGGLGD